MQITADHVVEIDPAPVEALLGADALVLANGAPARFEIVRLPDLPLPDGEVVASDALIPQEFPFTRRLRPGLHSVRLVVVDVGGDDRRIAFAILGEVARPVTRFELALTPGQDLAGLKPGNVFGYPVDSGLGSFASTAAHLALRDAGDLLGPIEPVMKTVYRHTRDWCSIALPEGAAAIFSSGVGDGLYASFFGLDADGEPLCLVTDFDLVGWPRNPMRAALAETLPAELDA